jgi:hypothetical protein
MEELSLRTMSFKMGKQVLDSTLMPIFASKYFLMYPKEKTLLL